MAKKTALLVKRLVLASIQVARTDYEATLSASNRQIKNLTIESTQLFTRVLNMHAYIKKSTTKSYADQYVLRIRRIVAETKDLSFADQVNYQDAATLLEEQYTEAKTTRSRVAASGGVLVALIDMLAQEVEALSAEVNTDPVQLLESI